MMKLSVFFLFAISALFGQALPAGFVAVGGSYNTTTKAPTSSGFVSFSLQVATRTYSETTVDFTQSGYSLRTGTSVILVQFAGFTLAPHLDGGITSTAKATLGTFSGGGSISYSLGRLFKKAEGYHLLGVVRMVAVTSTTVKPIYEFGVARSF